MSATIVNKNRQTIPRFLDYFSASTLGLLQAIQGHTLDRKTNVSAKIIEEWETKKNINEAIELVAEAILVRDFKSHHATKAAEYIISSNDSPTFIVAMAEHFLEKKTPASPGVKTTEWYQAKITTLRGFLRVYPHNPIAWSDLSLCYAALGLRVKSIKAMNIALGLGKNNRFILRSAASCFVFHDEPERAIFNLQQSYLCKSDPWIASAAVSIADDYSIKTNCINSAKALANEEEFSDFSRSELKASLGTIELRNGNDRVAKRLVKQTLKNPTENALAQAQWMTKKLGLDISSIGEQTRRVSAPFEATTVGYYYQRKYDKLINEARSWANFDFLNPDPIIMGSFVASSLLDNDYEALKIIENATPAQKSNPTVQNNKAFSLIETGDIEVGLGILNKVDTSQLPEQEQLVFIATYGFAAFRSNNVDLGRKLYTKAINGFNALGNKQSATSAKYYFAREEKRINSEYASSLVGELRDEIKRYNAFPYDDLVKKLD